MKSTRRKKLDPQNTTKKKKILERRNTHEKKICIQEILTRKTFVPNRKSFGYTKYLRGKVSDSQNTHEDIMTRWH